MEPMGFTVDDTAAVEYGADLEEARKPLALLIREGQELEPVKGRK